MIRIDINGQTLDLSPDTTIRLEINSPLFDFDKIQGTYTFPISIPLTPTNKKIFGFVHELESRASLQKTYECKMYLNNRIYLSGLFFTSTATSKTISGSIASGPGEFANLIKGKKLADVMTGDIPLTGPGGISTVIDGTVDDYSHVFFPVENPDAYGVDGASINPDWAGTINAWEAPAGDFQTNPTSGSPNNQYAICPYLYLTYIMEQVFSAHGYTMTGDFIEDAEIKTLVVYNNFLMDLLVYDTATGVPGDPKVFNTFATSSPRSKHVPDILISDFLIALRKMFCLTYLFDRHRKTVTVASMRRILADKGYREALGIVIPGDYEFTQDPSGYTLKFETDDADNTTDDYQFRDFSDVPHTYTELYGSLPASPTDGQFLFDSLLNQFFTYDSNNGLWNYYSENVIPAFTGDEANQVASGASPLMQIIVSDPPRPYIRNECTSIPFQSAAEDFEQKPCGLRLTFYRGRYVYTSLDPTIPIPVGCGLDIDNNGNSWNYSLFWTGDNGLYNIWWRDYVEMMMQAKRTKFDVRMSMEDLFNFIPDEKLKYGNSRFLPFNLSLTLTGDTYMRGEATLYRL